MAIQKVLNMVKDDIKRNIVIKYLDENGEEKKGLVNIPVDKNIDEEFGILNRKFFTNTVVHKKQEKEKEKEKIKKPTKRREKKEKSVDRTIYYVCKEKPEIKGTYREICDKLNFKYDSFRVSVLRYGKYKNHSFSMTQYGKPKPHKIEHKGYNRVVIDYVLRHVETGLELSYDKMRDKFTPNIKDPYYLVKAIKGGKKINGHKFEIVDRIIGVVNVKKHQGKTPAKVQKNRVSYIRISDNKLFEDAHEVVKEYGWKYDPFRMTAFYFGKYKGVAFMVIDKNGKKIEPPKKLKYNHKKKTVAYFIKIVGTDIVLPLGRLYKRFLKNYCCQEYVLSRIKAGAKLNGMKFQIVERRVIKYTKVKQNNF